MGKNSINHKMGDAAPMPNKSLDLFLDYSSGGSCTTKDIIAIIMVATANG